MFPICNVFSCKETDAHSRTPKAVNNIHETGIGRDGNVAAFFCKKISQILECGVFLCHKKSNLTSMAHTFCGRPDVPEFLAGPVGIMRCANNPVLGAVAPTKSTDGPWIAPLNVRHDADTDANQRIIEMYLEQGDREGQEDGKSSCLVNAVLIAFSFVGVMYIYGYENRDATPESISVFGPQKTEQQEAPPKAPMPKIRK